MIAWEAVRRIQEETGGFLLGFCAAELSAAGGRELDDATAVESLKALAISRMVLDNVENVESDWATQGLKVRQMGLGLGGMMWGRLGMAGVRRTCGG